MADDVRLGDIGTKFRATFKDDGAVLNISAAAVRQLKFRKPDGTVLVKTAALTTDGTDGQAEYVTVLNDLDQAGEWRVQGYLELAGGKWHADEHVFRVHANLI